MRDPDPQCFMCLDQGCPRCSPPHTNKLEQPPTHHVRAIRCAKTECSRTFLIEGMEADNMYCPWCGTYRKVERV